MKNFDRLNGASRVAGVDLARGLAVIGMLAAHLLYTEGWVRIFDGRSAILFATLAGVSVGLVAVSRQRLAIRAGALWVLGLLLIATGVPVLVILPAYGIMFLLLLPFTSLQNPTLIWIAAGFALVTPFVFPVLDAVIGDGEISLLIGWEYPFVVWIAFLLAGLAAARAGIKRRRVQWLMVGVGGAFAALGYGLSVIPASEGEYWATVWTAAPHSTGLLEVIGSGGFAIAMIGMCLLVCTGRAGQMTVVGWLTLPLRATGAMPLTAYSAQIVVWAISAQILLGDTGDLHGFRALEPFWPMTLGIVAGCTAWALLVGRGPLEWVIDRLSLRW